MIKIVVLGGGNLAYHLTNEFLKNDAIELVQVYNRSIDKIAYLRSKTSLTNSISALKDADIYIITVSDTIIPALSRKLKLKDKLVVHTSGAAYLNELKSDSKKGVFYPLQTFSKNKEVDFSSIPICIEAENQHDFDLLETLAKKISKKCYPINSVQRKNLHVSAVFVNNFVNHLYAIGNEICEAHQLPFDLLIPIIKETSKKIEDLSPIESQTGPAKRMDTKTIEDHLTILNKNHQEIYTLLTNSIIKTYGKKLYRNNATDNYIYV